MCGFTLGMIVVVVLRVALISGRWWEHMHCASMHAVI